LTVTPTIPDPDDTEFVRAAVLFTVLTISVLEIIFLVIAIVSLVRYALTGSAS
jgi:hypothetical protein